MERGAIVETLSRQKDKIIDRLRRLVWKKLDDELPTLCHLESSKILLACINAHRRLGAVLVNSLFRWRSGCFVCPASRPDEPEHASNDQYQNDSSNDLNRSIRLLL